MQPKKVYDIMGIGIGPFNLGLAALCHSIPQLRCLFIEKQHNFNWHPGMLLPGSSLQVPFYADLVTLADPCSPFSYMAFLKAKQRMIRFAIHENYFVTRQEYNEYGQWVAAQLPSLQFNQTCTAIHPYEDGYQVITDKASFYARHIVIGTGTAPALPGCIKGINHSLVFHSSEYLKYKNRILHQPSVTIIGSGQSAAEIFYDLLQARRHFPDGLSWFTRSPRFFPMEYAKLTLEMSSPEYIDHFFSLPNNAKAGILAQQNMLYKGINFSLINDIYDLLYLQSLGGGEPPLRLQTNCSLQQVAASPQKLELTLLHRELEKTFLHETSALVLATGYKTTVPRFLDAIQDRIRWDEKGMYKASRNYSVDENNSIYIQNAEHNTHGFNASDLGLGPYRNATIINTILGCEHFTLEKQACFQTFGLP
jgi:lysine N6-hydroxylase